MNYKKVFEKDYNGEDCVVFYDSNSEEILCVRFRQLNQIDPEAQIMDLGKYTFINVLTWVVRLARKIAAPPESEEAIELLREFTSFIIENHPEIDFYVIAETWKMIDVYTNIGKLAVEFEANNPITQFPNHREWRKQFIDYLQKIDL